MDEEIWAVGDREELDASRGGKGCESFCWSPTQALGLCWHLVAGSSHCRIRTQSLEKGVCKLEARGRGDLAGGARETGFLLSPWIPLLFVWAQGGRVTRLQVDQVVPTREPCFSELKCGGW